MQGYVERLEQCGWRPDHAWLVVEDFAREADWNGLEDFVRSVEIMRSCG